MGGGGGGYLSVVSSVAFVVSLLVPYLFLLAHREGCALESVQKFWQQVQSSYMIMLSHIFRRGDVTTLALQMGSVALSFLFSSPRDFDLFPRLKENMRGIRLRN